MGWGWDGIQRPEPCASGPVASGRDCQPSWSSFYFLFRVLASGPGQKQGVVWILRQELGQEDGGAVRPGLSEDTALPAGPTLPASRGPGKCIPRGQSCQPRRDIWPRAQWRARTFVTLIVLATQVKQMRFGRLKIRFG